MQDGVDSEEHPGEQDPEVIDGDSACFVDAGVDASSDEEGGEGHSGPTYRYQTAFGEIFGGAFELCFRHGSGVIAVALVWNEGR